MLTREEFERRFEWLALNIEESTRDKMNNKPRPF
jgi:hypothetical protein